MYTVFGIAHRHGEYNGIKFDNYNLSCLRDADTTKEEQGSIAEVIKVPAVVFNSSDVTIGDIIIPMYDRFGRVIDLKKN